MALMAFCIFGPSRKLVVFSEAQPCGLRWWSGQHAALKNSFLGLRNAVLTGSWVQTPHAVGLFFFFFFVCLFVPFFLFFSSSFPSFVIIIIIIIISSFRVDGPGRLRERDNREVFFVCFLGWFSAAAANCVEFPRSYLCLGLPKTKQAKKSPVIQKAPQCELSVENFANLCFLPPPGSNHRIFAISQRIAYCVTPLWSALCPLALVSVLSWPRIAICRVFHWPSGTRIFTHAWTLSRLSPMCVGALLFLFFPRVACCSFRLLTTR